MQKWHTYRPPPEGLLECATARTATLLEAFLGRIRPLPDPLINRIAAGEVVERPVSVVKELVENSLDAGARTLRIRLLSGGRRLVQVSDDGQGMDRDDALMAIERHATSKLCRPADLESIKTLGFRGEALSSIAAVSRFTLETADEEGSGTRVEVHGGRIQSVDPWGGPQGTTVRVERLFFNVPARRKFLRAEATELSQIVRMVTRYALAHPSRRVELAHGDRELLRVDPAGDTRERIRQIYGEPFLRRLLAFDEQRGDLRVHGFAGRPTETLPRRDGQHLFVNGRAVQDRMLFHAVTEAYGNTMPRGRFAALLLFIDLPPEAVDVNVHPRKEEVRFREAARIHDGARDVLRGALSKEGAVPRLEDLRPAAAPGLAGPPTAAGSRVFELREPGPAQEVAALLPDAPQTDWVEELHASDADSALSHAVPLGQYRESYIVAQDRDGLVLVDQHAAHERVLFERYLADAESGRVEVQRLLFPELVELTPDESVLVREELEEFRRLGFDLEPFGGNTVRLAGVPVHAADCDPRSLLRELIGEAGRTRSSAADVPQLRRLLVTSAACQAAIKVHYPLTHETMQQLLLDLSRTVNPTTCPHGRPALFRLTLAEIERAFHRR